MPRLGPIAPWIGQLATTSFLILWCLIFIGCSSGQAADGQHKQLYVEKDTESGVYYQLMMGWNL